MFWILFAALLRGLLLNLVCGKRIDVYDSFGIVSMFPKRENENPSKLTSTWSFHPLGNQSADVVFVIYIFKLRFYDSSDTLLLPNGVTMDRIRITSSNEPICKKYVRYMNANQSKSDCMKKLEAKYCPKSPSIPVEPDSDLKILSLANAKLSEKAGDYYYYQFQLSYLLESCLEAKKMSPTSRKIEDATEVNTPLLKVSNISSVDGKDEVPCAKEAASTCSLWIIIAITLAICLFMAGGALTSLACCRSKAVAKESSNPDEDLSMDVGAKLASGIGQYYTPSDKYFTSIPEEETSNTSTFIGQVHGRKSSGESTSITFNQPVYSSVIKNRTLDVSDTSSSDDGNVSMPIVL